MALTELEIRRTGKTMAAYVNSRRPPLHVRDEMDLLYAIEGQSTFLLEFRQLMDGACIERPFAKATYVRTQKVWKIYWMRANLKWHSYEPLPTVKSIQAFCDAVDADPLGCFKG